ncbi:sulfotransferase 1E1 [Musca domestica]|uniref:Sulfotransferase 1E1 n=1 Tax=Musca domestica TaxID=7370 RepID=A0A1I8MT27_MUSDO|nr:sulfotransferase 1E1 [Musca domestica]
MSRVNGCSVQLLSSICGVQYRCNALVMGIPLTDYKPARYPTNLLQKDWSKRKLHYGTDRLDYIKKVHDVEVLPDDVWLVTLPKCGTTWMQELLWLVMNNFDFETAKREHLELRSPYMEFDYMINNDLETCFRPIEQLSRPRLIKTHLSLPLLPHQIWDKKPKVVYVARNVKDAIVSEYYHARNVGAFDDKTLDNYVVEEIEGTKLHDPFLHITEFYALRHEPWLFYTSFECMKMKLRQVILDVCQFLNKTIDDETMKKMLKHLSFEEMKNNPKTNHIWELQQVRAKHGLQPEGQEFNFIRKGQMNAYKQELSPEVVNKVDNWVEWNLKDLNVTLDELLLMDNAKAE